MNLNWSKLLFAGGVIVSIGFFLRYFVLYIDYSQGILFIYGGLTLIAFSWIYEKITRLEDKYTAVGDYIIEKDKKLKTRRTNLNKQEEKQWKHKKNLKKK